MGVTYYISGSHILKYTVTTSGSLVFARSPADVTVTAGGSASFEVRILGGAVNPVFGDEYSLAWERSDDGGASWRQVGYDFQQSALEVSPTEGGCTATRWRTSPRPTAVR